MIQSTKASEPDEVPVGHSSDGLATLCQGDREQRRTEGTRSRGSQGMRKPLYRSMRLTLDSSREQRDERTRRRYRTGRAKRMRGTQPHVERKCSDIQDDDNEDEISLSARDVHDVVTGTDEEIVIHAMYKEYGAKGSYEVIIDSGANAHIFPYLEVFINFRATPDGRVKLADKSMSLESPGRGDTSILPDALYVPKLSCGIISVTRLLKKGFRVEFFGNKCHVYDKDMIILSGTEGRGELFYLDEVYLRGLVDNEYNPEASNPSEPSEEHKYTTDDDSMDKEDSEFNKDEESTTSEAVLNKVMKRYVPSKENALLELHRRWGHLSEARVKLAIRDKLVETSIDYDSIKHLKMPMCPDCLRGRMRADLEIVPRAHDWKVFEKIACDYKGPIKVRSTQGYRGFYLFSDRTSHYIWSYPVKVKDDLYEVLRSFLRYDIESTGRKVKVLQVDSDTVAYSADVQDLLAQNGIRVQVSTPYQKRENGQIERDMQNVLNRARTCMCSFNTPSMFWDYAVDTACWYINRSPTSRTDHATPLQTAYNRKPVIEDMVPFYCPGIYHVTKEERGKGEDHVFGDRGRICRFLGYEDRLRGDDRLYVVYDIVRRQVLTRSAVVFDRNFVEEYINDEVHDVIMKQDRDRAKYELHAEEQQQLFNDLENHGSDFSEEISDNPDNLRRYPKFINSENMNDDYLHAENNINYMLAHIYGDDDMYDYMGYDKSNELQLSEYGIRSMYIDYDLEMNREYLEGFVDTVVCNVSSIDPTSIILPPAPKDLHEALGSDNAGEWWEAVMQELRTLDTYETFEEANQLGHAMKTKLILTCGFKNDYTIKRKARLVVCGYSQIKGIDYAETFAPTTSISIVLLLLALAANKGYVMRGFDVTAAFLEGYNDFEQFCRLPKELGGNLGGKRVKIKKSLYGEKQAPKIWNDRINEVFIDELGFVRCPVEPCLYMREAGTRGSSDHRFLFIVIHVDDGLMVGSDEGICNDFYDEFEKHIKKISRFNPVEKYLGIDIRREERYIYASQETYIMNKMKDLEECTRKVSVPMNPTTDLQKAPSNPDNESLLPVTGKLRWLADRSRWDIAAALGKVSTGGSPHPSDAHVEVGKQIVKYVRQTIENKLRLGGISKWRLFAFCDASYITSGDSKGRLGGALFTGLDTGAFHCFSKNDDTVAHSSMEIEIKAVDMIIRIILFVIQMMIFIGCGPRPNEPVVVFCDNKSAVELCQTLKQNHKVKHINMRINFIREILNQRTIQLVFVPTEYNVADTLTKPLGPTLFDQHSHVLLNGFGGKLPFDAKIDGKTYEEVVNSLTVKKKNLLA